MKPDRYSELSMLWISRAKDDLSWANDSFDDKHYGGVCFLSQQIAEKSLKAYLFSKKQKLIRTHSLIRLLQLCIDFNNNFVELKDSLQILDDYYVDTRYPDMWDRYPFENENMARDALIEAEKVFLFVQDKLSS